MSSEIAKLREKVALSCRILGHQAVTKGSFGHVSARIPGTDQVLIKAKGPDEEALEFAAERDIITIRLDGSVVDAPEGLEPPRETAMHLAVFRARPEVMSVIHSHPEAVVVLTACEKPLVPMYGAYDGQAALRLLEEGIPTYPRTLTIIDDELGADFMRVMGDRRACLLRGHGMTTAGASVEDATIISLRVFELARLNYMAYAIGGPRPVPDLEDHRRRWSSGRGRQPRGGDVESSEWRYQRKLLEAAGL
ncbi:MAG TPA: class II aldolase/adducin family protein [Chloroflexota bacterium]|nr:class II aldolase/adducin family protein [Chloroflexota bacterium]